MTAPSHDRSSPLIAIVGPTAVGKSALAEELALALAGEVVSADSMQVYRGMDIGTAKPRPSERRAPIHCIDIADPGTPFSAALYQRAAREAIEDIRARGRMAIVCGGTGLYVRAALDDMAFPAGEARTPAREELERLASAIGPQALHARLETIDPDSAALIHPHNVRRTIRALEMAREGVSYAAQARRFAQRRSVYPVTFIGLDMAREALYERIDARVDAMVASGLLEEVRTLLGQGLRDALTSPQAIGYKELVEVLEGRASLDDAIARIKQATRRYAKRQLTWFRADPRVRWIDVTGLSGEAIVERAVRLVESNTAAEPAGA
ncbi:MAG: tRNA (adenosine(37)-N6)-dimethylallyltransferase MiaA [Actinomycetia bacterium]|nr:tRNA (adenosine(37)-N6)-dimethylallyltransferase MiaA [Actinomycetes bacterium]